MSSLLQLPAACQVSVPAIFFFKKERKKEREEGPVINLKIYDENNESFCINYLPPVKGFDRIKWLVQRWVRLEEGGVWISDRRDNMMISCIQNSIFEIEWWMVRV